ncbi:carboxypeptidase-like regulatory domain-containing protein [Saccharicrinis sp. FJH62]|uniref:carboxypeptidase-like regulatory domain-containing protein n=1 Tax=Saccharicrinis sp. FJH62 TaxID=3344657 RepID=UPI0035D4336C
MKTTVLLFFILFSVTVFGSNKQEKSKISGVVYENVRGYKIPLSLANIQCKGTTIGTFSEKTGDFELDLPEGKYTVTFSFAGYKPVKKELKIKKNKNLYLEITLEDNTGFAQN